MYNKLPSVTPVRNGKMKSGWAKATVYLGGKKVYAVRNKARPTVVHLLNFDRRHYSHGKPSRAGTLQGSGFVDKVQEEANAKLNSEIKKIFEEQ